MLLFIKKVRFFPLQCKRRGSSVAKSLALSLGFVVCIFGSLQVKADLGLGLGGIVESSVEDAVTESVEGQVETVIEGTVQDQVAEATEDKIEEAVEQDLVLGLGGFVESKVEEQLEDELVEVLEDSLADTVDEEVADLVEEEVENSIAEVVEESVESDLQESIEDSIEDAVTDNVEDSVEGSVEEQIAETTESSVDNAVESSVATSVESSIEDSIAQSVESSATTTIEDSVAQAVESSASINIEDSMETKVDDIIDRIESGLEVDEGRIAKDQWLVMADPESFDELAEKGYLFESITDLPGLGLRLAEVAAPSSFDITEIRQGVIDVVGKDRAEVDLNHIYTAGNPELQGTNEGVGPRTAIQFPEDAQALSMRVGMIDSAVDTSHEVLETAKIQTQNFVSAGAAQPQFHGTAIASIIVGNHPDYEGLAPQTELFAASVFEDDAERGEIASTVSLVRALDWLVSSSVDVLNISLAGPPNRLLEAALQRANKNGVIVLAAAGNGGPMAKPMYPAAYESVVAVTAVDASGKAFRLANRGTYLDLAAPGVEIRHAKAGGGFVSSSGTSFAVPFAATAAARLRKLQPATDVREQLFASAIDLGRPGRDEIYGYGLLHPEQALLPTVSKANP